MGYKKLPSLYVATTDGLNRFSDMIPRLFWDTLR